MSQDEKIKKELAEYKENYCKNNTVKSMVYENGQAIALLYKEIQKLNTNLISVLQNVTSEKQVGQEPHSNGKNRP